MMATLLSVSSAEAKPTKQQTKEAKSFVKPVQDYKKSIAKDRAQIQLKLNQFDDDQGSCLSNVIQQSQSNPVTSSNASGNPQLDLLSVAFLEKEQKLYELAAPLIKAHQAKYKALETKAKDPKLRNLARNIRRETSYHYSMPKINACDWYAKWASVGFDQTRQPDVWPGTNLDTAINKLDRYARTREPGISKLIEYGIKPNTAQSVGNFPVLENTVSL